MRASTQHPVALVTGAGGGIGRAIAAALAQDGFPVALLGRTEATLRASASDVSAFGVTSLVTVADVTNTAQVEAAVRQTVDKFGRLDVVVNNAGLELERRAVETTDEDWQAVLDTNLTGAFRVARAAAPYLFESNRARLINVSSIYAAIGVSQWAAYCAAKGGLLALTRALAIEWARRGVRVNAVLPGNIETDMIAEALNDPKLRDLVVARTPLRRLGQPQDITPVVRLLASESSDFITGQGITIDGGVTAW